MMKEPNWIVTLILGTVLGLLPEIITIIKNTFLRFSKNRIVGMWFVYEITMYNKEKKLTVGTCKIRNGFLHRYIIKMTNGNLSYSGVASVEDNHLYMKLKNNNDHNVRTETCWQRYDFSYNSYDLMYGLWLSNSYDNNTTCGISVLSKKPLETSDIDNIIKENFSVKWESLICVNT